MSFSQSMLSQLAKYLVHLKTVPQLHNLYGAEWIMNAEVERTWKKAVFVSCNVLYLYFTGVTDRTTKKKNLCQNRI
jgi:hypothetical protein